MAGLMSNLMEVVHDQSLPSIKLLQESFPDNKDFMINISTLFDPRYVFLIYAPILFAFNRRVGHRMIIALTWAEWANQILKWLLAGERPYWYVHERANELAAATNYSAAAAAAAPDHQVASGHHARELKQFPVTCELGAGSPSGHSMVTATVWYILIDAYLKGELPALGRPDYHYFQASSCSAAASSPANRRAAGSSSDEKQTNELARLVWSVYTLMLLMVSLSRVYLACHFPHQCLAGALLGCLLARLVAERAPMDRLARGHFALATCFMFASALGTYAALRLTGFDPLWSVGKAMRWCAKKEYIHLDTTPFFSMMRYLGFCLGAGLAYSSDKLARSQTTSSAATDAAAATQTGNSQQLVVRRLLTSLLSIAFGQLLLALPAPKHNLNHFYVISFVIYTTFSYAIAGPIPRLTKRLLPASRRPDHHRHQPLADRKLQ